MSIRIGKAGGNGSRNKDEREAITADVCGLALVIEVVSGFSDNEEAMVMRKRAMRKREVRVRYIWRSAVAAVLRFTRSSLA
jgi:hypothetical protein